MKIIQKSTGKVVAEIVTNRSLTLDEAIWLADGRVDNETGSTVIFDKDEYAWEDLDIEV